MSIEQLAAATKIPRRSLELLEEDRYDALPGPVFAKGFLRCCARALGVDAQTVMDLLFERERAALSARRRDRPPSAPTMMVPDEFAPRRVAANRETRESRVSRESRESRQRSSATEGPDELAERTDDASPPETAPRRPSDGSKRRSPRLRARPTTGTRMRDRVRARLPSPALFLWVVVAAFVAMVVLAAFNLVGGGAGGGPS